MFSRIRPAALVVCALFALPASPAERTSEAAVRAAALAANLRCLVCQNQSIAESNAELAVDLRRQIDEQIAAGRTDREIADFMVARYGDFVLYRPPFRASTLALWLGPPMLLVAGALVLRRTLARRAAAPVDAPLTEEERARAAALLDAGPGRDAG